MYKTLCSIISLQAYIALVSNDYQKYPFGLDEWSTECVCVCIYMYL